MIDRDSIIYKNCAGDSFKVPSPISQRYCSGDGWLGAEGVAKYGRMQARGVAVFGQPSSIRPELTGIALVLEGCPAEEDLSILTDSLSSMRLLVSMQQSDLPLNLYHHSVRQLLLHVVTLINECAEAGRRTRFIKVRVHRGGAPERSGRHYGSSSCTGRVGLSWTPRALWRWI